MSSTLERAGNICVRNEAEADHRTVENVIRRAFWNLYVPGCAEHYVAHVMRPHGDFVPELDLVLERDGQSEYVALSTQSCYPIRLEGEF